MAIDEAAQPEWGHVETANRVPTSKWPGQPWTSTVTWMLLGRSSELRELRDVADRARSGGSATLVVRRDPGVGKTVLLDEPAALAHDFRLIRTDRRTRRRRRRGSRGHDTVAADGLAAIPVYAAVGF